MPRKLTAAALFAGVALVACGGADESGTSSYDVAANQIEQAASALTSSTPDDTFNAMTEADTSAAGAAASGTGGAGGACDGDHRGKGGDGHGRGRGHGGGPGGGKDGQQLLLWYADLTAVQACRDQRASCTSSGDTSTCDQAASDCLKPILAAAFTAFCSDELAKCSDASAPADACGRIKTRCSTSDAGM